MTINIDTPEISSRHHVDIPGPCLIPEHHKINEDHANGAETSFRNMPAYTPRKLRIVTIGAGYSGLTLAHKFQHQHRDLVDIVDHTIYEARSELGGTWLVNTYPGVVCDVPSHIYIRL